MSSLKQIYCYIQQSNECLVTIYFSIRLRLVRLVLLKLIQYIVEQGDLIEKYAVWFFQTCIRSHLFEVVAHQLRKEFKVFLCVLGADCRHKVQFVEKNSEEKEGRLQR